MKNFIVSALLFLVAAGSLHAQNNGQDYQQAPQENNLHQKDLYQGKLRSYSKMQYWGLGLMGVGTTSLFVGVVLVASSITDTITTANSNSNSTGGIALIEIGLLTAIPGVVLTLVGTAKKVEYKRKLSGLSLGMATKGAGLSLTYRF